MWPGLVNRHKRSATDMVKNVFESYFFVAVHFQPALSDYFRHLSAVECKIKQIQSVNVYIFVFNTLARVQSDVSCQCGPNNKQVNLIECSIHLSRISLKGLQTQEFHFRSVQFWKALLLACAWLPLPTKMILLTTFVFEAELQRIPTVNQRAKVDVWKRPLL